MQVFDIANPDQPGLLGTLRLPGAGEEMYLLDSSHVALLKNEGFYWWWADWDYRWNLNPVQPLGVMAGGGVSGAGGVTFTLSAQPAAVSSALSISQNSDAARQPHALVVADVSAGAPVVVAQIPFEGSLQESRMVGQVLYVASNVYDGDLNATSYSGCRVTSFDLSDPANPVLRSSVTVGGWASAVYATDQYFFVAEYDTVKILDISNATGLIAEAGEATAPGYIADKFKLHQEGSILTIVSSVWKQTDSASDTWSDFTAVTTFDLSNPQQPALLGQLETADGQSLYATRFEGSRLYLVTAAQSWDPLAIVDLSNPAHPSVIGSVEVPGFSTYIQPLGDRLLTTGLVGGRPTVALYDVSDATKPQQLSSVSLGTSTSWYSSEAVWDEKAFNVFPDQGLILMPITGYDPAGGYASGVQLIDLKAKTLVKRGVVTGGMYPRRAGLQKDRILSLSATHLITVNAADRDKPAVTSDLEIAWSVDHTFLAGDYLIEVGGGDTWTNGLPVVTVTPAGAPDGSLATLTLPQSGIISATLRDGVLYLAQSIPSTAGSTSGSTLRLTSVDVSHLPTLKILGTTDSPALAGSYFGALQPLWVNSRTLIFASEGGRTWMSPGRYLPLDNTSATITTSVSYRGV